MGALGRVFLDCPAKVFRNSIYWKSAFPTSSTSSTQIVNDKIASERARQWWQRLLLLLHEHAVQGLKKPWDHVIHNVYNKKVQTLYNKKRNKDWVKEAMNAMLCGVSLTLDAFQSFDVDCVETKCQNWKGTFGTENSSTSTWKSSELSITSVRRRFFDSNDARM